MFNGAIIGFGNAARYSHWPGYAEYPEARIVAVVDQSEERRAEARALNPAIFTVATMEELAKTNEAIDFVDICTPPALHASPMLQALQNGWHVLCEKPLLLDPDLLESARQRAREAGCCLMPVHNWKYAPIIRAATATLHRGAIGSLRKIEIETRRTQDSAVADPLRPNWRRDPEIAGGGILMDHGWHAIYLALHWFDETPVDTRASLHRPAPGEPEDEATLTITFPAGEAHIFLSWNATRRENVIRLTGERGQIVIGDDLLTIGDKEERFDRALSSGSHHEDWFAAMLPDVIAAFRGPDRATEMLDEAALCLSVIRQAYDSAVVPNAVCSAK